MKLSRKSIDPRLRNATAMQILDHRNAHNGMFLIEII